MNEFASGVDAMLVAKETVIVVPCFNEALRLQPAAFEFAVRSLPGLSLIFVNDGSSDATGSILDGLCARDPDRLRVLHCATNQGKAVAVRFGLLQAFKQGAEVVGYLDADLATSPCELPWMLQRLSEPSVNAVFAARLGLVGRSSARSIARHFAGRVFAVLVSIILGRRIGDTQCGAKLFRNQAGVREIFARPFSVGWTFDVEILARYQQLARLGRLPRIDEGVVEHPLKNWRDVAGSKVAILEPVRTIVELVRLWASYGLNWSVPNMAKVGRVAQT